MLSQKEQQPIPAAISLPCLWVLYSALTCTSDLPVHVRFLPLITEDFTSFIIFFSLLRASHSIMEKQESLRVYPHISDWQIGSQNKRGFPEHWWLNKVWSPELPSDPTLGTLRHSLENRPLFLLFTKAGGFALVPQDVKEELR